MHRSHLTRFALAALVLSTGCGARSHLLDDTEGAGGSAATTSSSSQSSGTGAPQPVVTTLHPNGKPLPGQTECKVVITEGLPDEGHTHVPICTAVDYETNPPSSGNHWPLWAAFTTYDKHVPREMLVHDMEHGAVIMRYDCPGGCPDVTAAFEQAASDFGPDTLCVTSSGGAVRSRIIVVPDTTIPAPIALAAWQATYTATCIDPASLLDFVKKHYDHATEHTCAPGVDPFDPATGIPSCQGV